MQASFFRNRWTEISVSVGQFRCVVLLAGVSVIFHSLTEEETRAEGVGPRPSGSLRLNAAASFAKGFY